MNKRGLVLIILVLAIAGSWWVYTRPATTQDQTKLPRIRVGTLRAFSLFDYIASKKGFFTEEGIDVQLIPYSNGPEGLKELVAGKVDMAAAADFAGVRYIFDHEQIRVVTQLSSADLISVFARKDKGIIQPADLRGKKVGFIRKTAAEYLFGRFITLHGLTMNDITVVDLPRDDIDFILEQVEKGEIDAVVPLDPNTTDKFVEKFGENIVSWSLQDDWKFYPLLFSTAGYLKDNDTLIEKYLRALKRAEDMIHGNESEAKSILAAELQFESKLIDNIWSRHNFALGLNQELLVLLEDEARWVIENKLTEKTQVPNYLKVLYLEGLQKIKPESIKIIQ